LWERERSWENSMIFGFLGWLEFVPRESSGEKFHDFWVFLLIYRICTERILHRMKSIVFGLVDCRILHWDR
jgi:hypothetical protein